MPIARWKKGRAAGRKPGHRHLRGGFLYTSRASIVARASAGPKVSVALVNSDEQGSAPPGLMPVSFLFTAYICPLDASRRSILGSRPSCKLSHPSPIVIVDSPAAAAPALVETLLISLARSHSCYAKRARAHCYPAHAAPHQPGKARAKGCSAPAVREPPSRVVDAGESMGTARGRLPGLGQELAPPLQFRREYEAAFTQGLWVCAAYPGSAAHDEIGAVVQLVQERLFHFSPLPRPRQEGQ